MTIDEIKDRVLEGAPLSADDALVLVEDHSRLQEEQDALTLYIERAANAHEQERSQTILNANKVRRVAAKIATERNALREHLFEICELITGGREHLDADQCVTGIKAALNKEPEFTVAIIKPDAVELGPAALADVFAAIAAAGLSVEYMRVEKLPQEKWAAFYLEHKDRDFYPGLLIQMSKGPAVFMVLSGIDAIKKWRQVMGATAPIDADPGTLRRKWGRGGALNVVHGSDSPESALNELKVLGIEWPVTS